MEGLPASCDRQSGSFVIGWPWRLTSPRSLPGLASSITVPHRIPIGGHHPNVLIARIFPERENHQHTGA